MVVVIVFIVWLFAIGLLCYRYRRLLLSSWREPILRRPVLILESDDWGPGPDSHASALSRLSDILRRTHDTSGRHPVVTLGLVLSIPDTQRMRREGVASYRRLELEQPQFSAIRQAIEEGTRAGVFALQLHGREHFWPPALLSAADTDETVREWLKQDGPPNTEDLPPHLQSRWIDATVLPSAPLSEHEVRLAASKEVSVFRKVLGGSPTVAVPPTFIWNHAVEEAWASQGIRFIVTPGRRCEQRDENGAPVPAGEEVRNGDRSPFGPMYLVRNGYFEPAFGHRAEKGLHALTKNTRLGRPTLLETHRFNFTKGPDEASTAFTEIEKLIHGALAAFPNLMFVSTEELAERMYTRDPTLVELRFRVRLPIWLSRIYAVPRLRKLAWLTGAVFIGFAVFLLTPSRSEAAQASSAAPAVRALKEGE